MTNQAVNPWELVAVLPYVPGFEDGWTYEDELPSCISDLSYKKMFDVSKVDGVRMFPYIINRFGEKEHIEKGDCIAIRRNKTKFLYSSNEEED